MSTLKQGRGMIESVDKEVVIDSSEMISTDFHFFSRAGDDFDFIILFMFFVVFVSWVVLMFFVFWLESGTTRLIYVT